jgi:hypothetical protein
MFDWLLGEGAEQPAPASLPAGPQLCLISVADGFLALHNEGTTPARNVRVDPDRSSIGVVSRADEPFDVAPGESWTFLIEDLGPWTESGWQLTVTWDHQEEPVCVPLPPATI